jgi:hypothetical protein
MNVKLLLKISINFIAIFFMYLIVSLSNKYRKRDTNIHTHKTTHNVSTEDGYHTFINKTYETIHSHKHNEEPHDNQYYEGNYDVKNVYQAGEERTLEYLLKLIVCIFVIMSTLTFNMYV